MQLKRRVYGMDAWGDLFTARQALALTTLVRLIHMSDGKRWIDGEEFANAVQVCLALTVSRVADLSNGLCRWTLDTQCVKELFGRQALPMVWDFAESVRISESGRIWAVVVERFQKSSSAIGCDWAEGIVRKSDATTHPLPNDSAEALVTDPPYYDAVPYADFSDFFYVWLRRNLPCFTLNF